MKNWKGACPLKEEIADRGFDLMIMRELTGGLYFGKRSTEEIDGVVTAKDELIIMRTRSAESQDADLILQ